MILGTYIYDATHAAPFVAKTDIGRANLLPFPHILIDRRHVDGPEMSPLALRLFYALLFVSWNILGQTTSGQLLAYGARPLLRAIGRPRQESLSDLRLAFEELTACMFMLPGLDDQEHVKAPLLSEQHVDREGRAFWAFSAQVLRCCGHAGFTYSWLNLAITSRLPSLAALRLYELGAAIQKREYKRLDFGIDDLRLALEVGTSYRSWSDFNRKLLTPALNSISREASFALTHEGRSPICHRKVSRVTLYVTPTSSPKTEVRAPLLQPLQRHDLPYLHEVASGVGDLACA